MPKSRQFGPLWVIGILSWAFTQQRSILSGVLRFSVIILSRDSRTLDRMITENRKTPDRTLLCRVNAQDSISITQSGPNCRLFGIIGRS